MSLSNQESNPSRYCNSYPSSRHRKLLSRIFVSSRREIRIEAFQEPVKGSDVIVNIRYWVRSPEKKELFIPHGNGFDLLPKSLKDLLFHIKEAEKVDRYRKAIITGLPLDILVNSWTNKLDVFTLYINAVRFSENGRYFPVNKFSVPFHCRGYKIFLDKIQKMIDYIGEGKDLMIAGHNPEDKV